MIDDGFTYLALLLAIAGCLKLAEQARLVRLLDYVPGIVVLYFAVMVLASLGLWQNNDEINALYRGTKSNLLPAMIFLLLLKTNLRQIARLGGRLLAGFLAATASIMLAFVVVFLVFRGLLDSGAWQTFAALSGSWIGGTGNMVAVQGALQIPPASMGYTLLVDSVVYALWVVLLLALVPFAHRFNAWTRADAALLGQVGSELGESGQPGQGPNVGQLGFLLGISLLISAAVQAAAPWFPTGEFLTTTTWTVILVTILGIGAAQTRLGEMAGSEELAGVMLYAMVALIASRANLAELSQAPLYILAGMSILLLHAAIMVGAARLLKLDLFTCGVASLANIGGVASAPILAAAYSRTLIPVGVLMAMLGYVLGTGCALLVARILSGLAVAS
jgi:uncharacterized membrane protein